MPYKNLEQRRAVQRKSHAKRRAARRAATVQVRQARPVAWPADPAAAICAWSARRLIVPPGHPDEGSPLVIPDFGVKFLADVYDPEILEALLCLARKNAKSAIVAVMLLAHLIGPLKKAGFRAGVVSITKLKAGELKMQCQQIAEASGLKGLDFRRSPAPGRIESAWGACDILSSESDAGAASGFSLAICDELGLLSERDRALVNGMRSSVSARRGKFVALTVHGDGPFVPEILAREGDKALAIHLYQADPEAALDDEAQWHKANPGIKAGVKSLTYMRTESRRVAVTVSDRPSFMALDMNMPQSPSREMLCDPADLAACFVDELPERRGPVFIGCDIGEATSGTAWAAVWPVTGRVELRLAFGAFPPLADRAKFDAAPYLQMQADGELVLYPGRVTPVQAFLADLVVAMAGERVARLAADGYKDSESKDYFERAHIRWPVEFRRVGAGKDGGHDVRAAQRLILTARLRMRRSVALIAAVTNATIGRDGNGNPGLEKSGARGRIDILSALVIACGLAESQFDKAPARPLRMTVCR